MNNNMSATYHNRYVFHCASGGINVAFSPKNSLVFTHYHIHEKKHKGLCKKYEPYILKYMARNFHKVPYVFFASACRHFSIRPCPANALLIYSENTLFYFTSTFFFPTIYIPFERFLTASAGLTFFFTRVPSTV